MRRNGSEWEEPKQQKAEADEEVPRSLLSGAEDLAAGEYSGTPNGMVKICGDQIGRKILPNQLDIRARTCLIDEIREQRLLRFLNADAAEQLDALSIPPHEADHNP